MRRITLLALLSLFLTACSESVVPTNVLDGTPTIQATVVGVDGITTEDMCGGLSPCDAFDYGHDVPAGISATGTPGFCFLPPSVENHLSDPACSGDFVAGLTGFKLAVCEVEYSKNLDGSLDGTRAPTLLGCQAENQWQDMVEDIAGEFYQASVQFKKNGSDGPNLGRTFRLYVVRGGTSWAHRDVVVDPNLTTPADGFLHSIGYGNEPVKLKIGQAPESCVNFNNNDVQDTKNAATCLVTGETEFSINTPDVYVTFGFRDGNSPFVVDLEVSECLPLTAPDGLPLVDVPLGGCKMSVSSSDIDVLDVPATIYIDFPAGGDTRWDGVFADARLNVIQTDEAGTGVLPLSPEYSTGYGEAPAYGMLGWLGQSLGRVAAFLGPQPLHARPSISFEYSRMSDFQVAVMPLARPDASMIGTACANGLPSCLDLGTFSGASPSTPVVVHVTAPHDTEFDDLGTEIDVPDTRLHFFPSEGGSVTCVTAECRLTTTAERAAGWGDVVVLTDGDGLAEVNWALPDGSSTLSVVACGVARDGFNTAASPTSTGRGLGVWGDLGDCYNRFDAMTDANAFDNGPAIGFTPFEPVDNDNEVAIYGLPLEFQASTCPAITVDGIKGGTNGSEWEACATKTGFTAPLPGVKAGDINAWFYSYDDGESLYMAVEVMDNDLGNRVFVQIAEQYGTDGIEAAGDDLLVLDFGAATWAQDWHVTEQCVGNNAASLCGEQDTLGDGDQSIEADASATGSPSGLFFEFRRPLNSANNGLSGKEDLWVDPAGSLTIGVKLTKTQGQGGGKGGFVFPDSKAPYDFFPITLQAGSLPRGPQQ